MPIALRSVSASAGEKPGELLRDLHVLLLVDADRVRLAGDRLEPRVGVRDLLASVLAGRVHRDVAHRTRAVEGHERDEVLELGRLHLAERFAHPRRLELEHARRVAAGEHRVALRVVERKGADVDSADEVDRLVDDVEVPQPEKVHLQEPEVDDVVHADLRHHLRVGALLLQRNDLDERLRADDDTRGMDRVGARQAFERAGEVDDLLGHRVGVDGLAQLRTGLECRLERLPRPFRHELRDAVDDAVRDVEDAAGVTNRRARRHGREGDDLRDAVAPVLLGDVVDDAVAAGDREVDVHVRQVLARRVQEALEEQAVAHRVDVGDLEAVRGDRAGGRPTSWPDADSVLLREVDEVPDDQEVVGEAHLLDRLELEAKAFRQLRRRLPVALGEPLLAELDEVVERVAPLGDREGRQQDPPELDLDRAALRDLQRPRHRLLEAGEVACHLLRGLEEELVRVESPVRRVLQRVARLDAEERLVRERVLGVQVVDVTGRHEREAGLLREGDEAGVDLLLLGEAGVLQLDVRRVASEDLDEAVEIRVRVLRPALRERPRHSPRQTARERHDPARVSLEELPVDARLVVVALEVAERGELDEVGVALVRLGEEREMRVALGLHSAVVRHVHLAADDGLHAGAARLPVELDRTCE